MDVKTAFLNGNLEEEIFMNLPPGFQKLNKVWRLKKGLYGLKQVSHKWYKKICSKFEAMGFTHCHSDHGMFIRHESKSFVIVAIYIDDLLLLSNSKDTVDKVKIELSKRFEMTDLGDTHWSLGIKVI
jgi:hypothetical protein